MPRPSRRLGFILASTDHGAMIVNRFDFNRTADGRGYGVGFNLLERASYDQAEADLCVQLLQLRRQHFGDGVTALDCGANIGVFTVEWARAMTGWGEVVAIEAQERLYYALAGNIALNNCFNARAVCAAVDSAPGELCIPFPDYLTPGSFGSLELRGSPAAEDIGQPVDYRENTARVAAITIDSLELARLDLLKLDVERMELAALAGAERTIGKLLPIILVERLKADEERLRNLLHEHGYQVFPSGLNLLAVHPSDRTIESIAAVGP